MQTDDLAAFVLAGGLARRMGTDKATLEWGTTTTLLDHMMELLSSVTPSVHVVGRDPLPDLRPGHGPLEGVRTALAHTEADDNLIVAVDLPCLTPEFLAYLARRQRSALTDLLVCRMDGQAALCLGARPALGAELEGYLASGQRALQDFVSTVKHEEISEEELRDRGFDAAMFRNINTPEDYRRARND